MPGKNEYGEYGGEKTGRNRCQMKERKVEEEVLKERSSTRARKREGKDREETEGTDGKREINILFILKL